MNEFKKITDSLDYVSAALDRNEEFENNTLPLYLQALRAWLDDCPGYYRNAGIENPDIETVLSDALRAAMVYE